MVVRSMPAVLDSIKPVAILGGQEDRYPQVPDWGSNTTFPHSTWSESLEVSRPQKAKKLKCFIEETGSDVFRTL